MDVDIILDARASAAEIAELGLLAEQYGIRGVWVSSLLDARDPFLNFTTLAAQSREIRMGPIAVNPWDMHPVRIATALLTLNEMSGGRARIVIGGGGEALEALGLEPLRRVRAVRECVEIIKGAAHGEQLDYSGELYKVSRYHLRWLESPAPPVYVGANMEQMLRMTAQVADGVMLSDLPPALATGALDAIGRTRAENGRAPDAFWSGAFTAWHVYPDAEQGRREARQWLLLRGLFRPWVLSAFLDGAAIDIVMSNREAFINAFVQRTHIIDGVPTDIVDALVDNLTLTGSVDDLDAMIEELHGFERAGLKSISLRVYADPASAIRLIGERVVPVLR